MTVFKEYRIGSFAYHLGVAQAFLKHYEEAGLIDAKQNEKGYRYYQFPQAGRVFEYMRLHSFGIQIKQMKCALAADEETAFKTIDDHADELQQKADRLQAIVDEHRRFNKWHDAMRGNETKWEVKEIEPIYFLPHTCGQDFIDDDRVYEVLQAWCDQMPVTKSALYVKPDPENPGENKVFWGLYVTEANVKRCGIPLNGAVWVIPKTVAFVFHFAGLKDPFLMKDSETGAHPAFQKLRSLGLKPSGNAILINEMKLERDGVQRGYGRFVIPISE